MRANVVDRGLEGAARIASPAQLALFWLGIQAVWGALLGISLQARTHELAGANALTAYGTIATVGAFVAALVQLLAGATSDARRARGGDRTPFYVTGVVVAAAGIVWFYMAGAFAPLVGAYIVVQIGMNVAMGAYQAVIPDYGLPVYRGVASAWMAGFQSLGNAIGALLASFLGAPLLAAALVIVLASSCAATVAHVRGLPRATAAEEAPAPMYALVNLFVSRMFVYIGFYTLLGYVYFYVHDTLRIANAQTATGAMLLVFTAVGALGAIIAAKPSDKADKRAVAAIGGAGFIVALLIFATLPSLWTTAIAVIIAGISWGVFLVADWALGCRALPPRAAATSMATWNLAVVAPQMIAPALTTFVLKQTHVLNVLHVAPRIAFGLAVVEVTVGIGWLLRLPKVLARE